jgi:para-aminobenzoate synthetase component 1
VVFFDSARRHETLGRYSYIAADPVAFLQLPPRGDSPFAVLRERMRHWQDDSLPGLPPFQGGAAGLCGYDLNQRLERLPSPRFDEFHVPSFAVGLYDVVVAFDHEEQSSWIISQGFPERDPVARQQRAARRLAEFQELLARPAILPSPRAVQTIPADKLAPQFSVSATSLLTSNFSKDDYLRAIERAVEFIHAGDIFQVNLAQRFLHPAVAEPLALYEQLRTLNPGTFAAYFDVGEYQILSASPERFFRVLDGEVEARPIKGTRPRIARPEADLFAGDDLRQSEKDRAENVMIVDLLRNDLSRACTAESVQVTQLCGLEVYEHVQHLVSVIRGRLRDDCTALDLLRLAFPGGSITGAPKHRAMEIIAELEPTARGPYCGSLFYLGVDGAFDANILIRTITAGRGWWQAPAGGGIVAMSNPRQEYEETWHKAAGLLRAIESVSNRKPDS